MENFIAQILGFLEDGKSCGLEEISKTLGIPVVFVERVVGFLVVWSFAQFDEQKSKVKLKREFIELG